MFLMVKKLLLLLMLGLAISGCTHTAVSGQKLVELDSPVRKLSYKINSGFVTDLNRGTNSVNETVTQLTKQLTKRMPQIFALNGIETAAPYAQYQLVITPYRATYQSHGGHIGIDMQAYIMDLPYPGKKIWEADVHFQGGGLADTDEAAADKLSRNMLERLVSDGVVVIGTSNIVMPEGNSN